MKHFNQISKLLLIAVAIVGLAIGMSSVASYNNSSDNVNTVISAENMNNAVMDNKCGGDKAKTAVSDKVDEAKADVKDAKCGEGKCGEGKCGGDAKAANDNVKCDKENCDHKNCKYSDKCEGKCGEGKCGGDDTKAVVSENTDEAKEVVKEAKCGEGKCG